MAASRPAAPVVSRVAATSAAPAVAEGWGEDDWGAPAIGGTKPVKVVGAAGADKEAVRLKQEERRKERERRQAEIKAKREAQQGMRK